MSNILYEETLKQMSKTMAIIILALMIIVEGSLICSYLYIESSRTTSLISIAIVTFVFAILLYLAFFLKTTVTVTSDEIRIKTIPTRIISRKDIKKAEIQEIKALRQYGGWGVRYTGRKIGYISAGCEKGVMLHFENRDDIMISSKHPEELLNAVQS